MQNLKNRSTSNRIYSSTRPARNLISMRHGRSCICYVKYFVFLGFDSLPVLQDLEDRKKRTSESRAQKKKDLDSDSVSDNKCVVINSLIKVCLMVFGNQYFIFKKSHIQD